jgi:hypothetical protein
MPRIYRASDGMSGGLSRRVFGIIWHLSGSEPSESITETESFVSTMATGIVDTLTSGVHDLARPSAIQQPPSPGDITFAQSEMG